MFSYAATGSEMKAIDEYTIETIGVPACVLMERAALFVKDAVKELCCKRDYRIIAFCGLGNNGGDGVAAARMLFLEGYSASVFICSEDSSGYSEGMRLQLDIAKNLGMRIDCGDYRQITLDENSIVIDAIFGTGLTREVAGRYRDIIEYINNSEKSRVVSVDIPSGISSSDGKVLGCAIKADITTTFGLKKLGMIMYPGRSFAGDARVCDIGFPELAIEKITPKVRYLEEEIRVPRRPDSNKGTFGRVLIIAGHGYSAGAAILAAKAAYRSGAGLVKVLTSSKAAPAVLQAIPEAVIDTYDEIVNTALSTPENSEMTVAKDKVIQALKASTAVAFGMGIGTDDKAKELFELVLNNVETPLVLDADGLTLLAGRRVCGAGESFAVHGFRTATVLTPHMKELSRLTGLEIPELKENIFDIAKASAYNCNLCLVCKDAATVVASESGIFVNTTGNDGMSTGGSGDVLAGIIASLIAQGQSIETAAVNGVYIHGLAGDIAAEKLGRPCMLASDIAEACAAIMEDLEAAE